MNIINRVAQKGWDYKDLRNLSHSCISGFLIYSWRVLGFLLYSRQEFQVSCSIQDKSFRFPALFRTRVSGRCFLMKLLVFNLAFYISLVWFWSWIFSRVENFRMVYIGINAWSSHFDNLKINIILARLSYKCMKNCNNLRNCSSQSEKSEQPMREQKYPHWRKQLTDIQGESSG